MKKLERSATKARSRAGIWIAVALGILTQLSNALAQKGDLATGEMPVASVSDAGGRLENDRVAAEWRLRNGRLCCLRVIDKAARAPDDAAVDMEAPFAIGLGMKGVLRASDLRLNGIATEERLTAKPDASRYSDRLPGVAVHYKLTAPDGQFTVDWAVVLRQGSAYIRQVLTIVAAPAAAKPLPLDDVRLIDFRGKGAVVAGKVKGSPLVFGNFFMGFEQPLSESSVVGDHAVSELHNAVPLGSGATARYSSAIGVADAGQMRRMYQNYIERERAHPYRTFLHYNSWFDIGYFTPYSGGRCFGSNHAFGEELNRKRGVVLDSFLFDDGWDNHGDLWKNPRRL